MVTNAGDAILASSSFFLSFFLSPRTSMETGRRRKCMIGGGNWENMSCLVSTNFLQTCAHFIDRTKPVFLFSPHSFESVQHFQHQWLQKQHRLQKWASSPATPTSSRRPPGYSRYWRSWVNYVEKSVILNRDLAMLERDLKIFCCCCCCIRFSGCNKLSHLWIENGKKDPRSTFDTHARPEKEI